MDNENKHGSKKQYPRKYFIKPFPPNHNPLIGVLPQDTLHNVHDALALLQEITINPDGDSFSFSEHANTGYYFLMDCALRALRFEMYHRKG